MQADDIDASGRQLRRRPSLSGASAKPISGFGTLTTELYRCSIPLKA